MVDAGMRQMNTTGWMHNRARMITAMYLTKNLLIDWRLGEKYFATKLVDYDPCSNNGGWQWSSSTGCDSAPYFRIFNPFTQAKKFDPEAVYIKKHIAELKDAPVETILNWDQDNVRKTFPKYIEPIVDFKQSREFAINAFKNLS